MRLTNRALVAVAAFGAATVLTTAAAAAPVRLAAPPASDARDVSTSGTCPREQALVRRALERSTLRVDVEGDRRLDTVAVVTDLGGPRRCRAFVGVQVRGGAAYSAPLYRGAVPRRPFRAQIIGLPDLGEDRGAEIVVDTHARADEALAQMFTLTRDGLRRVHVPAFEDGTFVVEGGGVTYPRGPTADGPVLRVLLAALGAMHRHRAAVSGRAGRAAPGWSDR